MELLLSDPHFISLRSKLCKRMDDLEDLRNYFLSPSRRGLFLGISFLGCFYVAETISLLFGALGVIDMIVAVEYVLLTQYVARFYYSRPKVTSSP